MIGFTATWFSTSMCVRVFQALHVAFRPKSQSMTTRNYMHVGPGHWVIDKGNVSLICVLC